MAETILLYIVLIVLGAKLGGELAERFRQPAVLGELLVGIVLGASLLGRYIGMPDFALAQDAESLAGAAREAFLGLHEEELFAIHALTVLATIGVVLLLFEVGLESDVRELTRVGVSSLFVAIIGIVGSFGLGYGFSWALSEVWPSWQAAGELAGNEVLLHVFVGAALTATSVGITARVLADMERLDTGEARIILGAAVLDDIGGLIILAVVAAMVQAAVGGDAVTAGTVLWIAAKAFGFVIVALLVGLKLVPPAYDWAVEAFRVKGLPVALAVAFALLMAYLGTLAGLADIVGAFAGGLILAQTKHSHRIFEELRPITWVFVSFFFVTLGMRVDLRAIGDEPLLLVLAGLALTVVAMAAKLACGLGVTRGTPANRWVVGVGMSPRGEVGLIFASLGLSTGLIANWQYTMVILVVLLTTFITPIWLRRLGDKFRGGRVVPDERAENISRILEAS